MEDGSDGDEFIADNDLDYLSRVLTLRETTSNHEDFIALQQQAAAEGRTLPPSTLRAMLLHGHLVRSQVALVLQATPLILCVVAHPLRCRCNPTR